ncbi:MAG: TIGR01777 family oxidoreductase [Chitinophagaceae bacterium]
MATILITGGTGLIGKSLVNALLEKKYEVIIVSREKLEHPDLRVSYALWDIRAQTIDADAISKADHIIHLAGAGVADKRWTVKRKKEIVDSRVKSCELLVKAIHDIPNHIQSVISASAIGWYGPDPAIPNPHPFTEDQPANDDFLGQTCKKWEESLEPITAAGKRLVKMRTGIVLSNDGGALKEFTRPVKFGLATILGSGKQMISWIHIDDLVRAYIYVIENTQLNGAYNAVGPRPINNKELVIQLASSIKGKFYVPVHVPAFVLKIMLGEMSIEVLKSATVDCQKLHTAGFTFLYPDIQSAIEALNK